MALVEQLGKPAVFIVASYFAPDARFNASSAGLENINLIELPYPAVPLQDVIEDTRLGESVAGSILEAFQTRAETSAAVMPFGEDVPAFHGRDYPDAVERMEQYFLQHCWSDGYPMVPPTPAAVARMLKGTDLPPEHLVAEIEPKGGAATVEKIAINAVMAGCRPHYMPLLIAAVEALAAAEFDLRGVQCTAGLTAPLVIVSGPGLVEQLNLNDSFSAVGPGWRANSSIGRALRLVMINCGYSWPGKSDMKSIGSPFKNVICMAENEEGYQGHWQPLRVSEGFAPEQATVSVIAALTWQAEYMPPEVSTAATVRTMLGRQARVKYDKEANNWGMDNLVIFSPTAFGALVHDGVSRSALQHMVYEEAHLPAREFFQGKPPKSEVGAVPIPADIVARAKEDPETPVPLLRTPESLKVVVAGAPGPAMMAYVSTWGWGLSGFVTRPVQLPRQWDQLLEQERGWETPIVKRPIL